MSRQINQPINQVKLTNVAVVRCNKAGKRFEIACYRNKVLDYRAGLETDLSEVLQSDRIFTNVSKGQFAKVADLQKAFGTRDQEEIAKQILEQSDKQQSNLQISDLERAQSIKDTLSQIATWVSANCVHADGSDRPFTPSQIKHALGKNYTVHPHKPIKKQCLDAVKFLKTVISIERAKMEVQLQYAPVHQDTVELALDTHTHRMVRQSTEAATIHTMVIQVDPSLYREFGDLMQQVEGTLEILQQVVMSQQGDMDLEQQVELQQSRQQQQQNQNSSETDQPSASATGTNTTTANHQQGAAANEEKEQHDSDVEDLVERLQNIREQDDDNDDDDDGGGGLPHLSAASSRKEQKKNRKKSKKQKRREQEEDEERQKQKALAEQRRQEVKSQCIPVPTTGDTAEKPEGSENTNGVGGGGDGEVKSCNTCGGAFETAAAYRAHFRSDWHRFNQKLKLKGIPAVSEQEFLLCDADTFFN